MAMQLASDQHEHRFTVGLRSFAFLIVRSPNGKYNLFLEEDDGIRRPGHHPWHPTSLYLETSVLSQDILTQAEGYVRNWLEALGRGETSSLSEAYREVPPDLPDGFSINDAEAWVADIARKYNLKPGNVKAAVKGLQKRDMSPEDFARASLAVDFLEMFNAGLPD